MGKKAVKILCPQCRGKGKKIYPGTKLPVTCRYCAGDGQVTVYVKEK